MILEGTKYVQSFKVHYDQKYELMFPTRDQENDTHYQVCGIKGLRVKCSKMHIQVKTMKSPNPLWGVMHVIPH